jgi:hypothetical protein
MRNLTPSLVSAPPRGFATRAALRVSPNPASAAAAFEFELERAGDVSLRVYDVTGRVAKAFASERLAAGRYSRVWNLSTARDGRVPPGIHFAELDHSGARHRARVVVVD